MTELYYSGRPLIRIWKERRC